MGNIFTSENDSQMKNVQKMVSGNDYNNLANTTVGPDVDKMNELTYDRPQDMNRSFIDPQHVQAGGYGRYQKYENNMLELIKQNGGYVRGDSTITANSELQRINDVVNGNEQNGGGCGSASFYGNTSDYTGFGGMLTPLDDDRTLDGGYKDDIYNDILPTETEIHGGSRY